MQRNAAKLPLALSTHAQIIIDEKVLGLREALNDVRSERDFLIQRVEQLESHTFETKEHKMRVWGSAVSNYLLWTLQHYY